MAGARHGMCELTLHGMAWARHGMCELTWHGMAGERLGRAWHALISLLKMGMDH
jgi:hypothetical protein